MPAMSKDDDSVGTKSLAKGLKQRGPPKFRFLPADRGKQERCYFMLGPIDLSGCSQEAQTAMDREEENKK